MTSDDGSAGVRLYVVHQPEHIARIREHLSFARVEIVGTATLGRSALGELGRTRPDVVLVDAFLDDISVSEFVKEAHALGAAVLVVGFDEITQQLQRGCILAGASEVLPNPSVKDLETVIARVHENERAARNPPPVDGSTASSDDVLLGHGGEGAPSTFTADHIVSAGVVLAFYAPKGGVGCTTVAMNAALALAETGQTVCLVDANLQFGDIDLVLGSISQEEHRTSLAVARQSSGGLVDEATLIRALQSGPAEISLLAAPTTPEGAWQIPGAQLQQMLALLRERFRYVCVNTSVGLNEHTVAVLDAADQIVLVTAPEFAAVRNTLLFIEVCGQLQYPSSKVRLVVNRADARAEKEVGFDTAVSGQEVIARLDLRGAGPQLLFPATSADRTLDRPRAQYRELARQLIPPSSEERARAAMGLS